MSETRIVELFPQTLSQENAEIIAQKKPKPNAAQPLLDDLGLAVEALIVRLRKSGPLR